MGRIRALRRNGGDNISRWFATTAALCLTLIVGFAFFGCNKQRAAPNSADFVGVYRLISVNGEAVPANISHNGVTLEVRSGTFTIDADGTCSSRTIFVPPSGQELVREVDARYTRDGSKLTMQWEGAGTTVGTIEGNTFTMDNESMLFVYEKWSMRLD